jgi:GNAT superfamily N-acetyltransferase
VAYQRPVPLTREHVTAEFESGESALDDWLKRYALPSEAARSARVYVTTEDDRQQVVGYYALSAGSVEPVDATARAKKGLPDHRQIPVALLARLAVDLRHQGKGVGSSLLQDAMVRAYQAAESLGIRALLVHAKHDRAQDFYKHFGFEPSPTDPLHLMILMKDVRARVESVRAQT